MATYVLIHGAWQGAGGWQQVKQRLEAQGHEVHTPTLKGQGARKGELDGKLTLADHAKDVIDYVVNNDLRDVVLVGHSYGGMVVSQAAETIDDRVKTIGYVDAFYPKDGQSAGDLLPEAIYKFLKGVAAEHGDGWRLPAGDGQLDLWGLLQGSKEREFVKSQLCDFSMSCFDSKANLSKHVAEKKRKGYIASVREGYPGRPAFQGSSDRARDEKAIYDEVQTGHDSHVENPDAVVSFLKKLA